MYRVIDTGFWSDPRVKELSAIGKAIFGYLITNRHTNLSGLYEIPDILISHETGWTVKQIQDAWTEIQHQGLAKRDGDMVLVINMLRHQGHNKGKALISAARYLETIHETPLIDLYVRTWRDTEFHKAIPEKWLQRSTPDMASDVTSDVTSDVRSNLGSDVRYDLTTDSDSVSDSVTDTDTDKKREEAEKVPQRPQRRFSDRAQNLVDLWNEKAPPQMPRIKKLSDGLRTNILKAYKDFPERSDWEGIIHEYYLSDFLRRKDEGHIWKDLAWLVSKGSADKIENYVKVQNGRYRNADGHSGFTTREQKTIDAAQRLMARYGFDGTRQALTEGEAHGDQRHPAISDGAGAAGDGARGRGERGPDGYLLPGSEGLPDDGGAGGADLGEALSQIFPEDR